MKRVAWICSGFLLAGCSPTVNVATPDPVKIDVNMKVEVYSKELPKPAEGSREEQQKAAEEQRKRMGELYKLRSDQVVGEGRDGYVAIVKPPADAKYAEYAAAVVMAENNNRMIRYQAKADKDKKPLNLVEKESAEQWQERAFPKEWIQKSDGTWVQK
jgi:uncharacterized protein YdbL (DUF1318 family)